MEILNLVNQLNLTDIDEQDVSTLIFYNWGDLKVIPKIIKLDDSELISIINANFREKWQQLQQISSNDLGAVQTKVITDNQEVTGTTVNDSSRVISESALNADVYIESDKSDVSSNKDDSKSISREYKEQIIDNRLIHDGVVDRSNQMCYTISKDIVNCLTLGFY